MASTVESDGNSDYVESTENSPTSPAKTPNLAGHIRELEEMHEVADSKIIKLTRTTVLFYRIDEIKLTELNDAETDPPENLQDNGATLRVLTQPYPLHSPLEDDLVDPAAFLPCPCVKAGNAALQA